MQNVDEIVDRRLRLDGEERDSSEKLATGRADRGARPALREGSAARHRGRAWSRAPRRARQFDPALRRRGGRGRRAVARVLRGLRARARVAAGAATSAAGGGPGFRREAGPLSGRRRSGREEREEREHGDGDPQEHRISVARSCRRGHSRSRPCRGIDFSRPVAHGQGPRPRATTRLVAPDATPGSDRRPQTAACGSRSGAAGRPARPPCPRGRVR